VESLAKQPKTPLPFKKRKKQKFFKGPGKLFSKSFPGGVWGGVLLIQKYRGGALRNIIKESGHTAPEKE